MSEIVYLPDGTQAIQTQLTGSNIAVDVIQLGNANTINPASSLGFEFDMSYAQDVRVWIAIDKNFDMMFYPRFTAVGNGANLTQNIEQLASNQTAPGTGRTYSYRVNSSYPAKSGYILVQNKDASLPATISVWVVIKRNV